METLLAAAVTLSCSNGAWILAGLVDVDLSEKTKSEIRTEIIQTMPDNCTAEQYNPSGRNS